MLFPAGGKQGQKVDIAVTGKFPVWPAQAWVDRTGLTLSPREKPGEWTIEISADAPLGVYWIRYYDASGPANPLPFVVGALREVLEVEPNDKLSAATPVGVPWVPVNSVVVEGRLQRAGDVDVFAIPAKAGQTLVADLDAQAVFDAPFDGVLQLVSPEGFVQAQNDDHQGLDPRLTAPIPRDGLWRVRVFGFPAVANSTIGLAGSDSYVYRLTLTTGPFVDYTLPLAASRRESSVLALRGWNLTEHETATLAPTSELASGAASDVLLVDPRFANSLSLPIVDHPRLLAADARDATHPVAVPATITGVLEQAGQRDRLVLAAPAGSAVVARVESRRLGYDLDPVLEFVDAAGKSLAKADDTGDSRDTELSCTVPADGGVQLVVADLHRTASPRHVYRLTITPAVPDVRLQLPAHQATLAAGAAAELTLTIDRQHGFAASLAIAAEGLPPGVTLDEAASQPGDETAKQVKLTLRAAADAAPFAGPIRLIGRAADQPPRTVTVAIPDRTARLDTLWLTVTAVEAK